MFEKATRLGLRFDSQQGLLTVEDVWGLPLTSEKKANLDDIAKNLSKQLKESENESFVVKATNKNETLQLKFDIVKYIIGVRLAENEAALIAKTNKEKKQKLIALLEKKKDEALSSASIDDIQAQIDAL